MSSQAFSRVLTATGYLLPEGQRAPGLKMRSEVARGRLRPVMSDDRVGLRADAVFSAQNTPTTIFKDAGETPPTDDEIRCWHEAAWNVGLAPLLWIITPTDVRLYDCYASPPRDQASAEPLDEFRLDAPERLQALDAICGRLATETGAFWSSPIGAKINRRHRVDRELLSEIKALEERLTALPPAHVPPLKDRGCEIEAARDFAQRLIGRCIFTWYLLDRGIAQHFLPTCLHAELAEVFATTERAFALFEWLHTTFNGDLFPIKDSRAELDRLGPQHLALLQDFVEGRSLVPGSHGQGRLFRFRFNAIPVELISSIYQQFARSSAAEQALLQGLHYTPVELVHLTLDPVFEGLPATARIIDPTCGSGAFLVEAFRRLVWKRTGEKPASRAVVRDVLYHQLFGIDINRSALGIAAFSLYLAALELDEEKITDAVDLKFDRLTDATLFEADTIGGVLPAAVTERPFDAVVGNPPWTFVSSRKIEAPKRKPGDDKTARPRRSRDRVFLAVAARLAGEIGRIGMVMKATPFFSKDKHALKARSALLRELAPTALVNLSLLRKEHLFPDASGPALLFFARCALLADPDKLLVGSVPWTPDFRRTGLFHVGPGEIRAVPLGRVLRTPPFLKAVAFGTVRDGWLIERLEREYPTLDDVLRSIGIKSRINRGQGFKVNGAGQSKAPEDYFTLPVVTPEVFTPFRLNPQSLGEFTHKTLHRTRRRSIFRAPLLICSKVGSDASAERGRYSAAISETDVLYTESFTGVSFAEEDRDFAHAISGVLNSSLTAFQLAFGGPTWGLERPTVLPHDLLSLRVPCLLDCGADTLRTVVQAEKLAAGEPRDPKRLAALDDAVFDLYQIEPDERALVRDSVARARYLIFETHSERGALVKPPDATVLRAYAGQVAQSVDAYLRARGERHLEAVIYPRRLTKGDLAAGVPGATAVRFVMACGGPGDVPIVRDGNPSELDALAALLRGRLEVEIPPYLNERRQLRLYGADDLFVLKPTESRYWTRTAGLNDADVILADHWLQGRGAAVS